MKFTFPLACISFFFVLSCSSGKDEVSENVESDSTTDASIIISEEEEEENINDEDHGDPGLEGLIIDRASLEPELKTFLESLTRDELTNVISNNHEMLLLEPGPGVSPIYSFANSAEDLLKINELMLFLSDSSVLRPSTIYRMVYDACQIIEGMPEGIYVRDIDFKDLTFSDSDEALNQKLQQFINEKRSDSGAEMIIKYRDKRDDLVFLHLYTIKNNGGLFLVIIDQRDCGA